MSDDKQPPSPKRGNASRDWPNTIAAAAKTGLSKKQLNKLAEQGALRVDKDSMGVWRWDPDLLELVATARESGDVDDDDDDDAPAKRGTGLAEAIALLRQSHVHQEQTLSLVRGPASELLQRYADDNKVLRERIAHLEKKHDELIEAREKYLSEQYLRDMLAADQERAHARKDKALKFVTEQAPKLLGIGNAKADAAVKLLQSFSEEQRAMLLLTDMLTDEQKAHVRALMGDAPAETAQAAE